MARLRLIDSTTNNKILENISLGPAGNGFSEDSNFFFFMDYGNSKNILKKYNIAKMKFEDDVAIPRNHVFIRAIDAETLVVRWMATSTYERGDYGILSIKNGLLFNHTDIVHLKSSFPNVNADKIEFVAVNPQKTVAAIVTTYAQYVDSGREQMGRVWSQYNFEVFQLDSGQKIFSSETIPSYDWQMHTDISGVDAIYFRDNSLVISGFERRTNHTTYDLNTNKVQLISEQGAAKNNLPVVHFDGTDLNVEITAANGQRRTVSIPFEGFSGSDWSLQEKFQYSFLQNNEVLVVSKNQDFVAAIDVLNGTTLDYEKVASIAGKEKTLSSLFNLKTRRYNP